MAGFFGLFDYTKEGPGIPKDAPPKGPFATFFDILGRKFWKVVTVNLMFVLLALPGIALAFFLSMYLLPTLFPGFGLETLKTLLTQAGLEAENLDEIASLFILVATFLSAMLLTGLSYVTVGPTLAGVTYIFRNYAREEHAFLWSDFIKHARSNWKQSFLVSVLSTVVVVVLSVNYAFYAGMEAPEFLKGLLLGLIVLLFVLVSVMLMYIYPMMVTFRLTIRQMMKNALLFSIARLFPNLGILLLSLVLLFVLPAALILFAGQIGMILGIFYYLFLAFGVNSLVVNFYVYRQLKKYMIDHAASNEEEADAGEIPDEIGDRTDSDISGIADESAGSGQK